MTKPGILLILGFLIFACESKITKDKAHKVSILVDSSSTHVSLEFRDKSLLTDSFINYLNLRILHNTNNILTQKTKLNNGLILYPPIPFTNNITYGIYHHDLLLDSFIIIPKNYNLAQITGIFPTQDSFPENLLKIYIEFNTPMQSGEVMKYIHLVNQENDTLKETLLEMNEELWNTDRTRLTIWLHPGRVKRGLIPNEKMGNPLQAGKSYKLIISKLWQSQMGSPLSKDYTKDFFVTKRDETIPNYKDWKITAHSTEIKISFDEPMDYALLLDSLFQFIGSNNQTIHGTINVNKNCKEIVCRPNISLPKGAYIIHVFSLLEDLAGNNLNYLFERPVFTPKDPEKKYHTIPFYITD